MRTAQGLRLVLLLLTDIGRKGSHVWGVGDDLEVVERAFGVGLVNGAAWLDGCMSRKKQIVPPLERAFGAASRG